MNVRLKQLLKLAGVILAGAYLQKMAALAATAYRGYEAIGGEIFVFPLVVVAGYYLTGIHRALVREERRLAREAEDRERKSRTFYLRRRSDAE